MADEKPTVTDKASPLEMEKVKHSSLELELSRTVRIA